MNAREQRRAPLDIEACRRNLAARQSVRRRENRKLWNRARADASAIVACIVRRYRPERVWQWGSVLRPAMFGPFSDIDIAVEGEYDAETWFQLLGEVWAMTEFSLDCVDLRRIEPEFADLIRLKGKVVYERNASAS